MLLKTVVKTLKSHQEDLSNQGVRTLAVFGSLARKENTPKSDVDILIDFDSKRGLFAFVGLKDYLEEILPALMTTMRVSFVVNVVCRFRELS